MLKTFPELKRVRGSYLCPIWGERWHWWLITANGDIIDPTVDQFPSKGIGEYIELTEDSPIPVGRCMNCGNLIYTQEYTCSEKCALEVRNYYFREY